MLEPRQFGQVPEPGVADLCLVKVEPLKLDQTGEVRESGIANLVFSRRGR
ncbi:MAG: hypothetical protein Ct9H300mP32_2030 [Verrucomicrobiota bacterium]|nr:MAG: hypothetical protein Ct9H300mP32_2030 [Verrucomicrobiota bacterium]